ncbi:MAG: cytochrome b/b6 domain-containing protein, partial [Gammaproteobacteria bacterium]|nr:cytochrome b/b6 domain-containing protein [Gammaproteobacteria bacterium]
MQKSLYVWDIVVRSFHWLLVLAFALAFATEDFSVLHAYIGYFILGLIAVRLLWGVIGSKHARFSDFIYRPRVIKQYLKDLFFKRAKHYVGHNPAGGLMIVLMLISLILTAVTGHYAYESEVFMIYAEHESWLVEVH